MSELKNEARDRFTAIATERYERSPLKGIDKGMDNVQVGGDTSHAVGNRIGGLAVSNDGLVR